MFNNKTTLLLGAFALTGSALTAHASVRGGSSATRQAPRDAAEQQKHHSRRVLKSSGDSYNELFDCDDKDTELLVNDCSSLEEPIQVTDDIIIKGDIEYCTDGVGSLFELDASEHSITFDCEGHALLVTSDEVVNSHVGNAIAINITNIEHDITIQNCIFLGQWEDAIQMNFDTISPSDIKGELSIKDSIFTGVEDGIEIKVTDGLETLTEVFKVTVERCTFTGIMNDFF